MSCIELIVLGNRHLTCFIYLYLLLLLTHFSTRSFTFHPRYCPLLIGLECWCRLWWSACPSDLSVFIGCLLHWLCGSFPCSVLGWWLVGFCRFCCFFGNVLFRAISLCVVVYFVGKSPPACWKVLYGFVLYNCGTGVYKVLSTGSSCTNYFVHAKVFCTRHHVHSFSQNTTSSHFSCAFFHSHFAIPSFLLNHYNLTNLK